MQLRSLWSGAISFGLVNIPVKLYAATKRQDIKFNYLHKECHTPVRYEKVCPVCKKPLSSDQIVKGFAYAKGQYVIFSEQDFANIAVDKAKTIDIIDFVSLNQIDPIYFDKTYYLEPSQTGNKAYRLLKEAMEQTNRIAIAKVVIRSKQALAAVRVYNSMLTMETMFFPNEIRSSEALIIDETIETNDSELNMAVSLINNLTNAFEPDKYKNEYQAELAKIIDAKISGDQIVSIKQQPAQGQVADLMSALEASLKATEEKAAQEKQHALH